jgi:type IV pilus assembly protein PilW
MAPALTATTDTALCHGELPDGGATMMRKPVSRFCQRGLTLIEMMVAMTIGLVFLLALSALFLSFKQTSQGQHGIAQMQDDQRMAMTILSQVIQSAGYFPIRPRPRCLRR